MFTYKNPFNQKDERARKTYTQEEKPVQYNGCLIFEHVKDVEYHIVKDGYVVGMNVTARACKLRIDGKTVIGLYDVKNKTHLIN